MPFDLVTLEHHPHPEVLTKVCETVTFPLSPSDQQLIAALEKQVIVLQGVGLAAPQLGASRKIVVINVDKEVTKFRQNAVEVPLTILINPTYQPTPDAKIVSDWEGCISVTETSGKVPRYDKIRYCAQRPDGSSIDDIATGFTARVIQHEIDHVNGILIVDRLTPECIQGHPRDMMLMRYQELDIKGRAVYRHFIEEEIKINDTQNRDRLEYLKKALQQIEEIDRKGSGS